MKPQTKILGVYYANDRNVDESVPIYIERLANGLKDIVGDCIIVQVKNSLLSDRTKLFIEVFVIVSYLILLLTEQLFHITGSPRFFK